MCAVLVFKLKIQLEHFINNFSIDVILMAEAWLNTGVMASELAIQAQFFSVYRPAENNDSVYRDFLLSKVVEFILSLAISTYI